MAPTEITVTEFAALDLTDWRYVLGAIHAEFRTSSFTTAAGLALDIAEATETSASPPDLDLRSPGTLRVVLAAGATDGVTTDVIDAARRMSAMARSAGAVAVPHAPQSFELAIDTMDADAIRPFWAAVLGYQRQGNNLVDPYRLGPTLWFQQMTEPRTERNRFHVDIDVPHDVAAERIRETLAAGGRLVTDEFAPAWWVLADVDGNEACVCTWQGRDTEA